MPVDVQGILKIIQKLAELEKAVSNFYAACGERWKEEEGFWIGLSQAESGHAGHLATMAGIMSERPRQFASGRPMNPIAIDTAISGIKANTEKVKKGDLQTKQAIFICRDIENSILEFRYAEVVKTDDLEFNTLVSRIVSETTRHRALIFKKIEGFRVNA